MTRLRDKGSSNRADLDALLDSTRVGHFGFTDSYGYPVVIPTAIVRDGDRVLAHGSTGSTWMRLLADGVPTSLAVTVWEGLVVARSAFESSMHYRSAILFGTCVALDGEEKLAALDLITEAFLPGRVAEVRRPTGSELAATLVLALPIDDWSLKVSRGWPTDSDEDLSGGAWAGVVPIVRGYGEPAPAPDLRPGIPVPPSVRGLSE